VPFLAILHLLAFETAARLLDDLELLFVALDFHVSDSVVLLSKVSFQECTRLVGYFPLPMDTLSSRITTLRNAQRAGRPSVLLTPRQGGGTRLGRSILRLLVREGYIDAFSVYSYSSYTQTVSSVSAPLPNQTTFLVHLKYGSHGQPAFHSIQRVSTPARRVYISSSAL
jgi:ribosomal protein S8